MEKAIRKRFRRVSIKKFHAKVFFGSIFLPKHCRLRNETTTQTMSASVVVCCSELFAVCPLHFSLCQCRPADIVLPHNICRKIVRKKGHCRSLGNWLIFLLDSYDVFGFLRCLRQDQRPTWKRYDDNNTRSFRFFVHVIHVNTSHFLKK